MQNIINIVISGMVTVAGGGVIWLFSSVTDLKEQKLPRKEHIEHCKEANKKFDTLQQQIIINQQRTEDKLDHIQDSVSDIRGSV